VDRVIYTDATEKIRDLKARLPEASVRSLAEEVIRRAAMLSGVQGAQRARPSAEDISSLTRDLLVPDPDAALKQIQALQSGGADLEEIHLIYLSAAAQLLGTWWEDNKVSFHEVLLGTSRIYGILRALEPIRVQRDAKNNRTAMFATVPGDQHVLGVRIAADIFRQRGWDIELLLGLSHDEIVAKVDDTSHLIIGLSAGGEHVIAALARLVLAIRMHKPGVRIFVGGQAVAENPDLVAAVSPDGMAADFEVAYDKMFELWRLASQHARVVE